MDLRFGRCGVYEWVYKNYIDENKNKASERSKTLRRINFGGRWWGRGGGSARSLCSRAFAVNRGLRHRNRVTVSK